MKRRTMVKSEIRGARITGSDLRCADSITIDPQLLEAADVLDYEQVAVLDIDNGARFQTHALAGERGSGEVTVTGAAARLVRHGDLIVVRSYALHMAIELNGYVPRVVRVAEHNQVLTAETHADELAVL